MVASESGGAQLDSMEDIERAYRKIDWTKELLAEKIGTTVEEVSQAKILNWGWQELTPEKAEAMGDLLECAVNCVNLK